MKSRLLGMMCLSLWSIAVSAAFSPVTRLTIRVVDDQGAPVQGAIVEVGGTDGRVGIKGPTDTNGLYRHDERIMGELGCEVAKSGYYQSRGILWSGPSSAGMVPPVNVYTVVLKRIVHPVSMIHRTVKLALPMLSAPVGLDLAAGDWVAPHGKGESADLFVTGQKQVISDRDWSYRCTWLFTNGNGVVSHRYPHSSSLALRSRLVPPLEMPVAALTNRYEFHMAWRAGQEMIASAGKDDHLLFQVRTVTNAEGVVTSANVGWINGAIDMWGLDREPMHIGIDYYFNPDPHSRSLEPEEIAKRQTGP